MPHAIILILIGVATLVAVYVMMVRPFLRARPELASVFAEIDNREAGIAKLFWHYFDGFRTILWSRFLMISGLLLPVLDSVGTINLAGMVDPKYAAFVPIILVLIGFVTEYLRRITTKPVPSALPADPIIPPAA